MTKAMTLRPSYWASVSGGKDSFYMLNLILHNLDKYPLDGVVHFELEIDYPFIKDVIDMMEAECTKYGIKFMRIKPRKTWDELYHKKKKNGYIMGFPTGVKKWCNTEYKLDAKRQLDKWLKESGCYSVCYIGYCVDEEKRYSKRKNANVTEVYPLVEHGIREDEILEWAKNQPIYNGYYKVNKRCGCMYCPMMQRISYAYLLKHYPENYEFLISRIKESEEIRMQELGKPCNITGHPKYNADYLDHITRTKWLKILEEKEAEA